MCPVPVAQPGLAAWRLNCYPVMKQDGPLRSGLPGGGRPALGHQPQQHREAGPEDLTSAAALGVQTHRTESITKTHPLPKSQGRLGLSRVVWSVTGWGQKPPSEPSASASGLQKALSSRLLWIRANHVAAPSLETTPGSPGPGPGPHPWAQDPCRGLHCPQGPHQCTGLFIGSALVAVLKTKCSVKKDLFRSGK